MQFAPGSWRVTFTVFGAANLILGNGWKNPILMWFFETSAPMNVLYSPRKILSARLAGGRSSMHPDGVSGLDAGWRFEGLLCEADDIDTGAMWECPLMVALPRLPDGPRISAIPRRQASGSFNSVPSASDQLKVRHRTHIWLIMAAMPTISRT